MNQRYCSVMDVAVVALFIIGQCAAFYLALGLWTNAPVFYMDPPAPWKYRWLIAGIACVALSLDANRYLVRRATISLPGMRTRHQPAVLRVAAAELFAFMMTLVRLLAA